MIRNTLISALLLFAIFFRFSESLPFSPLIEPVWTFDREGKISMPLPPGIKDPPFNMLYEKGKTEGEVGILQRFDGKKIKLSPRELAYAPFQGIGYFTYMKAGSHVDFHSQEGEILWSKEYSSYPVTDDRGRLLLLLTGDNNEVEIADRNGTPAGAGAVAGNLMTDYSFASRNGDACIVFAGGEFFALNVKGELLFQKSEEPTADHQLFMKSCAISSDGELAALHLLRDQRDHIEIFRMGEPLHKDKKEGESALPAEEGEKSLNRLPVRKEPKLLASIELPVVYPHLLHFSIGHGGLLLTAPGYTAFFDLKGDEIWKREEKVSSVYRAVYSDRSFYVYESGVRARVLDGSGNPLVSLPVPGAEEGPYRILPGSGKVSGGESEGELFAVDGPRFVQFYRYRATDKE